MNILLKSLTIMLRLFSGLQARDDAGPFSSINDDCKALILKEAFISEKMKDTNFQEIDRNLSSVCKYWKTITAKNAKGWVCPYFWMAEKNKDDFWVSVL